MKPQRIAAIIFVIGGGLIGSYYIIKNSMPSPDAVSIRGNSLNSQNNGSVAGKNSINWLAQAVNTAGNLLSGGNNPADSAPNDNTQSQDSQNLTDFVAGSLFGKMKNMDQGGNDPFSASALSPTSSDNQKLIDEAIAGISDPATMFASRVSDSDIKISNDNSKEAKLEYLNGIINVSKTRFSDQRFKRTADDMIKDMNQDCFAGGSDADKYRIQVYPSVISDYLNLSVPSDFKELHKQL
ncbi:MAG: hypothetical protein NTW60_04235, partial [Candidatus Wolfebacteria bacterium]|nr:hypothetical protein [Candidatus Wolfebacteria bacterium]